MTPTFSLLLLQFLALLFLSTLFFKWVQVHHAITIILIILIMKNSIFVLQIVHVNVLQIKSLSIIMNNRKR